jgi:hypothetical protein
MRWTKHRIRAAVAWGVVVAWAVFSAVALPGSWVFILPVLWVVAARLVLRHRRARTAAAGTRRPAMDSPGRLIAAAVAVLRERRREWGRAMTAELAEVEGRSARWRFALSGIRAVLGLPPVGGRPVLVLTAGLVVASVVAAGPVVGAAVPGLNVFAAVFTGLVGAMVVLAVARSRRLRLPVPAPTILVTAGVAASITVTVIFLRREPAATEYLPPAAAVYLAAVLAGCLWIALAAPRWLGTSRLAPHLGAAAGLVFAAWFWLSNRTEGTEPPLALLLVLTPVLVLAPLAAFIVPAFAAGRAGRSLRSGLQAAVWTVAAIIPLTYAVWLPEGLRRHAIDGKTLMSDGEMVPVGVNLADALIFSLGIFPVIGLTLAVIGAGLGSGRAFRAVPNDPA